MFRKKSENEIEILCNYADPTY